MVTRRYIIGAVAAMLGASCSRALAQDAEYWYDDLGRLKKVRYPNGYTIEYSYDAGGNRTQTVQSGAGSTPTPTPSATTLQLTGSGPYDLRSVANAAGYGGAAVASYIFEVPAGAVIVGVGGTYVAGGAGIDTGTWPAGVTLALVVKAGGSVSGGGGGGGYGGTGPGGGGPGGAGGDAVYCRVPITITVESGGVIRAGGGGGGGGHGGTFVAGGGPGGTYVGYIGAGGGGGGAPNGIGGAGGTGTNGGPNGSPGGNGSTSGGGAGGGNGPPGGDGGGFGQAGGTGQNGGAGGGATGYAIRKNGNTVSITNGGTITGAQA